jgi:hypothetical protein
LWGTAAGCCQKYLKFRTWMQETIKIFQLCYWPSAKKMGQYFLGNLCIKV